MIKLKEHLEAIVRINHKPRGDYLRLDMNENLCGVNKHFINSLLKDNIDSEFLSTYPEYDRLIKKVAKYDRVNTENILLTNGSDSAIKLIFESVLFPGDKVLYTEPSFAMYPIYCDMYQTVGVAAPYKEDLSFPLDYYREQIKSGVKIAVIVNPNNPTGGALSIDSIIHILNNCKRYDTLLIVDEAYFHYYPFTVIRKILDYDNLVVIRTFSKAWGLAALRIGYIAADSKLISYFKRVQPSYDVNGMAVHFAEKLMDNPIIMTEMLVRIKEGRAYLLNRLVENGIDYIDSKANFLLIRCSGRSTIIKQKLLEDNILVAEGFKHDTLKDYIRVTLGPVDVMDRFWNSFERIWSEL